MSRLIVFLIFFLAATAQAATNQRAVITEFADFLAIPNLASDAPNIARNAAAIQAMFEKRGVTTRLLTLDGAPPIVVVDLLAPGATRTIAFYAHYDGQRWMQNNGKVRRGLRSCATRPETTSTGATPHR